jgi:hypothetical protein
MWECIHDGCDRLFDTRKALWRHKCKCLKNPLFLENPQYSCTACKKSFFLKERYGRHLRTKRHADACGSVFVPQFRCRFSDRGCTRVFSRHANQVRHANICKYNPSPSRENVNEKLVKCPEEACGKEMHAYNLARHMARNHGAPVYPCIPCAQSSDSAVRYAANFYTPESLESHTRRKHRK